MKSRLSVALVLLLTSASSVFRNSSSPRKNMQKPKAFIAMIRPIDGASVLGVSGTVTVVTLADNSTVSYSGSVMGVQSGLMASTCTATNGCGVHIHSGMGCGDSMMQGGHFYVPPTVMTDPWVDQRYSSNSMGIGSFGNSIEIGTSNIGGLAFVVHAEDGSRIGCGILMQIPGTSRIKMINRGKWKMRKGQQTMNKGLKLMKEGKALLYGDNNGGW